MRYKIILHHSEEGYSVWIPGLPDCCSQGATEAEAIGNIKTAEPFAKLWSHGELLRVRG